jgi:hypothetical protein
MLQLGIQTSFSFLALIESRLFHFDEFWVNPMTKTKANLIPNYNGLVKWTNLTE